MGTTASAKIIAIPIMEKSPEPATVVKTEATPVALPTASESLAPAAEPNTTLSLRKVFQALLAKFTRERIITALLGGTSIAAMFLFWYFGTK